MGSKSRNGATASDFVRTMPATMKAKEIVAAGKAKGIRLSPNLVYMVRSTDKKNGRTAQKRGPGRRRATTVASAGDIATFKKMAFALGISTARRALDEFERGLAALLG